MLALSAAFVSAKAQEPWRRTGRIAREPAQRRDPAAFQERITHRGFEASRGPFHVVAATSAEDARRAVLLAEAAWREASKLVEHFAPAASRPAVAPGAVQIDVSAESSAGHTSSVIVVGSQVRMFVNVGEDRLLTEQTAALRAATATAYLHLAELDRQLPQWVCRGLAAYIGGPEQGDESSNDAGELELTALSLRRGATIASGADANRGDDNIDGADAAKLVRFLLEGNDAAHAPDFFAALSEQVGGGRADRRWRSASGAGEVPTPDVLKELVAGLEEQFAAWRDDPQLGQPLPQDPLASDADAAELQRQMWFILKLAHRFGATEASGVKARVTEFDRQRRQSVISRKYPQSFPSVESLYARLTDPSRASWATLDPQGGLLVQGDNQRLRELLGLNERRFQFVSHEEGWALQTRLADGRRALAWLVPNPDQPRRPIAKFEIAGGSVR